MLQLAPTNPSKIWIASTKRNRRDLGKNIQVVQHISCKAEQIEGIACQPVFKAIISSANTIGTKRALDASKKALFEGFITKQEATTIKKELQNG